ncbi:MAG TPA: glycoside hydrolase family 2 TIM barrel-domain containing protein [Ignavibacteria bacterium]
MNFKVKTVILTILYILFFSYNSISQIKVFEKSPDNTIPNSGLFLDSPKRTKIDLNSLWQVSFDNGQSFSNLNIPLSYNFEGRVIFKKNFGINIDFLNNSSFIFVIEAANYEADIKINDNFVTKHTGGYNSLVITLEDNILQRENVIQIELNNKLNNSETIPLANQINYTNNFGGIYGDIYLITVPKIFVFESFVNYNFENETSVKVSNTCYIKSANLEQIISERKDFQINTKVIKKSTGDEISSSDNTKFQIDNYSNINVENKLSIKNISAWSPENPELYIFKVSIINNENVIDEFVFEFGFTDMKLKSNSFLLNGKPYYLKGINYHQESVKSGVILDYKEFEKDLLNIKSTGFNCIRVPGKSASPFIINLCNRLGLFLFQDFAFNEVPQKILSKNKYITASQDYLESIIKRDKNSVCILAWGIGNNFDVISKEAINYVNSAKELIRKYDSRPIYYTTRNFENDICSEIVDIRGINFFTSDFELIQNSIANISTTHGKSFFISSYGVSIINENRNGFSDIYSMEYQTKFLTDCYKIFSKDNKFGFISSYADWNTDTPLILSLDKNPYLKTDGIYTFNREQKQSVNFLMHILNNQSLPKLMEGTAESDSSYIFVISGLFMIFLFLFFISKEKKLKETLIKFTFKPKVFFELIKEHAQIPVYFNIILSILINAGLALYISAVFYHYRTSNSFDVIISNIIPNDFLKLLISEYINSPIKLIIFFLIVFFILQVFVTVILYIISFFTKGKPYYKNIYTVNIWSSISLILFLPFGTIIYKLSVNSSGYIIFSLYLYIFLTIIFLYRIISGTRILLEINKIKTIAYSLILIITFYGGIIIFFYYKGTFNIINLIMSYN